MVTLCLTDILAPYPDATVLVHNLGGNIPYEIERMDHRQLLDTPNEELPSSRFRRAKVFVDCNSFGARAIEAAVRFTAPSASSAAPTAPNSAASGPAKRLRKRRSARMRARRSCTAMPKR